MKKAGGLNELARSVIAYAKVMISGNSGRHFRTGELSHIFVSHSSLVLNLYAGGNERGYSIEIDINGKSFDALIQLIFEEKEKYRKSQDEQNINIKLNLSEIKNIIKNELLTSEQKEKLIAEITEKEQAKI